MSKLNKKIIIGNFHWVDEQIVPKNVQKMMEDFPVKELFDDSCPEYIAVERLQKWYKDKFGTPK